MSYGGSHYGSSDDERLLERFGQWLRDARAEAEHLDRNGSPMMPDAQSVEADVGLYRLVEEFTALRHEVKLQTRSSRGLEEESEALVSALRQAIDALRSIEPREAQAAWSAGKALATALAELDDALERGRQQTEKAVVLLEDGPSATAAGLVSEFYRSQPWLYRWLHRRYQDRLFDWLEQDEQQPQREAVLDALLDGYRLIQKRLSQTMAAEGILRIDAVGRPVDPEQMVVVEVVETDDLPGGVVFDELRRGYTWNGRVLRYAEVRATRQRDQGSGIRD
jgi:molecular chaperone GrpE